MSDSIEKEMEEQEKRENDANAAQERLIKLMGEEYRQKADEMEELERRVLGDLNMGVKVSLEDLIQMMKATIDRLVKEKDEMKARIERLEGSPIAQKKNALIESLIFEREEQRKESRRDQALIAGLVRQKDELGEELRKQVMKNRDGYVLRSDFVKKSEELALALDARETYRRERDGLVERVKILDKQVVRNKELEEALQKQVEKNNHLVVDRERLESERNQLGRERNNLARKKEDLFAERDELNRQLCQVRDDFGKQVENNVRLNGDLAKSKKRVEDLEQERSTREVGKGCTGCVQTVGLQQLCDERNDVIRLMNEKLVQLQTEMERMLKCFNQDTDMYNDEIPRLNAKLSQLRDAFEKQVSRNVKLVEERDDVEKGRDRLIVVQDGLRKRVDELEEKAKYRCVGCGEVSRWHSQSNYDAKEINRLNVALIDLQKSTNAENVRLSNRIHGLEEENGCYKRDTEVYKSEIEKLIEVGRQAGKEAGKWRSECEKLQAIVGQHPGAAQVALASEVIRLNAERIDRMNQMEQMGQELQQSRRMEGLWQDRYKMFRNDVGEAIAKTKHECAEDL